jgi:pyruvate dehydrogenase E1 component beta subunit
MTASSAPAAVRQLRFGLALNEALREELRRDERVFVMGVDVQIGVYASVRGLASEFGTGRVINMPISELAVAGAAVGAAVVGLRPVAHLMNASFTYLAMDQLVNQAGLMRYMFGGQAVLPITYMATTGGMGSKAAHHSQSPYSVFMHAPGLKVVVPSTPYDAKGLLKAAIRDDNPVVFLEHGALGGTRGPVPEEEYVLPLGVGDVKRQGDDVTVVAIGLMVPRALRAAEQLAQDGIECDVIDPRTLYPLDRELIRRSVRKTGRLVAVDEANYTCGAAAEVLASALEDSGVTWRGPARRVTVPDVPIPFSPPLERAVIPDEQQIIGAVREVAGRHAD